MESNWSDGITKLWPTNVVINSNTHTVGVNPGGWGESRPPRFWAGRGVVGGRRGSWTGRKI